MRVATESGGGKAITIDVTISGTPIDSLILDTGAGISTINEDLLSRFSYRRLGAKGTSLDGSGVGQTEYFVEVASLCTLGPTFSAQRMLAGYRKQLYDA